MRSIIPASTSEPQGPRDWRGTAREKSAGLRNHQGVAKATRVNPRFMDLGDDREPAILQGRGLKAQTWDERNLDCQTIGRLKGEAGLSNVLFWASSRLLLLALSGRCWSFNSAKVPLSAKWRLVCQIFREKLGLWQVQSRFYRPKRVYGFLRPICDLEFGPEAVFVAKSLKEWRARNDSNVRPSDS